MKIGFNIDSFRSTELSGDIIPNGGVGVYLQELLRVMLSLESKNQYYLIRNKPGPAPISHPRVHILVSPFHWLHHGVRHSGLWRDWVIRKHRLDLLHEHHPDQPALRFTGIPFVVTVHDLVPLILPDKHTARFNRIFRTYVWRNLKNATAVIAVSDHTKKDICHFHPELADKIKVIPGAGQTFVGNVVPDNAYSLASLGIRKPYMLNVSTIEPRKNHEALFDAFALAKRNGYPHQLVCIGSMGWKTGRILNHAALKQYADDILLLGQVNRHQLGAIYAQADWMIYPSLYEGFGIPPLEAMEFGVPVIVSRNSSLPELLGEAALYLSPHPDGSEIFRAMEELRQNATRRKEMARLGYMQRQRFTWEKAAAETLKCYETVAATRRIL